MSLIKVFLPYFKKLVRDSRFRTEEGFHPVFYYQVSRGDELEEVYFYKVIGSFIYSVRIVSDELPDKDALKNMKIDFEAEEIPQPLYHNYIELTGRQFQ